MLQALKLGHFIFFPHLLHLLVFSSNAKDDNKQGGSWLIVIFWFFSQVQKMTTNLLTHRCLLVFFLKCKRWWRAGRLSARHNLIVFFLGAENNDEARGLLSFLNFFFKCKRQPQAGIWACRRFLFFYSCCTQRHHMSCPRFNLIINKISII